MTKEEKRKLRKLKRKASKNANKRSRRKAKVAKIKARKGGKAKVIASRKSAKINRQDERTARTTSRSSRKLARQDTRQEKIQAKADDGYWTADAIQARMAGYGDIAGSVAEGAVSGALGPGGSVLDLLTGDKDEDGDPVAGTGKSNLTKYILIGGAALVGIIALTRSH